MGETETIQKTTCMWHSGRKVNNPWAVTTESRLVIF